MPAPHIMIVDDDRDISEALSDFMRDEGYRVTSAHDWKDLFKNLSRGGIDLMILDIMLPEVNGIDILRMIKQHNVYRLVPIIVVTAMDMRIARSLIKLTNNQFLFAKPIDTENLMRTVHTMCPL